MNPHGLQSLRVHLLLRGLLRGIPAPVPVSPWPQSRQGCFLTSTACGSLPALKHAPQLHQLLWGLGCALGGNRLALVVPSQGSPTLPSWGSLQSPSCWSLEMDTQNLRMLEKCDRNCWMPNSRGTRLLARFGLGIPDHIWSSWLPPSTPTVSQLDAVLGAEDRMSWQRVVGQLQTPGVTCPASGGISFWQRGSHPAGF